MKTIECTCYRLVDGEECHANAKYEIRFKDRHIGYACGTHSRAYTAKALFPIAKEEVKK